MMNEADDSNNLIVEGADVNNEIDNDIVNTINDFDETPGNIQNNHDIITSVNKTKSIEMISYSNNIANEKAKQQIHQTQHFKKFIFILQWVLILFCVASNIYLLTKPATKCECQHAQAITFDTSQFPSKTPSISPTTYPSQFPSKTPSYGATLNPIIVPMNGIIIWSNCSVSNIPIGWTVCDGSDGTPNLKGKFVIGADSDNGFIEGSFGGNLVHKHMISTVGNIANHTLSVEQMPRHNHNNGVYQYLMKLDGLLTVTDYDSQVGEPNLGNVAVMSDVGENTPHSHELNVSSTSIDSTHLPPYYVLCYIMKNETSI